MLRFLGIVIVSFLMASCATNKTIKPDIDVKILKAGLVKAVHHGRKYKNENSILGYGYTSSVINVYSNTSQIPLKIGNAFGIEWCALGLPDGEHPFEIFYTFRPFVKHQVDDLTIFSTERVRGSYNQRYCTTDAFEFGTKEELLPGYWTIKVTVYGEEILSKEFNVNYK